jgi:homoserine dehydrogenase
MSDGKVHRAARAPHADPGARLIANVEGAMNAVLVKGDAVGHTMYYGKGAGAEPTASAVIADLVDVARMLTADPEQPGAAPGVPARPAGRPADPADRRGRDRYYLRLRVADEPGVLADITRILADRGISIDAMLQREPEEGEDQTDIILLTHRTIEKAVDAAIAKIEALPTVLSKAIRIRLEELN